MPRIASIAALLVAVGLLLCPATAAAKGGKSVDGLAAGSCAQERKELGKTGFQKKYGRKSPMRTCARKTRGKVRAASEQAVHACQQELALLGWSEFALLYGSDETGADAFAECVAEGADEILNPSDVSEDEIEDEELYL